jgi:hypothetical protein
MRRPLQVYLDPDDHARLEAWARARECTKSQAIRLAVRALTTPPDEDPVLALSGMLHGLPADLSERFERHLDASFVAENAPGYRTRVPSSQRRLRR